MSTPIHRRATLAGVALVSLAFLSIQGTAEADYGNPNQVAGMAVGQQAVNDHNPNFFVIGRRR